MYPTLPASCGGTALVLLAAATLAMTSDARADEPVLQAAPVLSVAAADNSFGFRLLEAVQRARANVNVLLSPVSAALDLSMVLNAASDQTQHEMLAVLALGGSNLDAINAANSQLLKAIRAPAKDVTLSVADSLWVNSRRARLRADYVQQMRTTYDADIEALDFSRPGTVTRINDWASQATQGKISTVIDRVEPADLAVFLDAVYFKGQWTYQFDPAHTQPRDFTLANGTIKQAPRMSQTGHFGYLETPTMQAIRLPFGEGDLAMDVLLPTRASSLGALEKQLTGEIWASWHDQYLPRSGTVELPRFELKASYRLNEALQHLGMVRAFQPNGAQLAGMVEPEADVGHTPSAGFFISTVVQSTFWKVDESGAEAAAVTTIGVRTAAVTRAPPPFQLIVDRPFFCAIEDRRTGALLFVAAIYDPTS